MKSLCVFCGACIGLDPQFAAAAAEFGQLLAASGCTLIYGGGRVGLMGILADATLAAGGKAVGVIPQTLADREVAHAGLTHLHVVQSMHERKALMAELADGFVALPGGIGTMEEFFEVWTWGQLGLHSKPYGLLNVRDFYSPLLAFLDQLVAQDFIRSEHREMLLVDSDGAMLLARMTSHRPRYVPKWIDQDET